VRAGEVWTEGCFTFALFQGWGMGSEILLKQVQLNFSFQNKLIIFPCGRLVDNNAFFKMCVFKSLAGCTDYGGYVVKRDSDYTHIRVYDHIVAGRSVLVHG
jgi:CDP-diglyceride synthetase